MSQIFRRNKMHSGLTLIEILFSLAIISTVVTLAYGSALSAWQNAVSANQRTQAQYLLQKSIEYIRAYRDSSVSANPWYTLMDDDAVQSGSGFTVRCDGLPATCSWLIEPAPNTWKAAGSQANISDATDYQVTVRPIRAWTTDPVTGAKAETSYAAAAAQPDRIDAISVIAEVTYNDAKGVASNAKVSTIISGRQN